MPKTTENKAPIFVRKIWQLTTTNFAIEWTNGVCMRYLLGTLQANCPCAACRERPPEQTPTPKADIQARSISSVGRYALRIDFDTGCNHGIFDFDYLYSLGEKFVPTEEPVH